MSIQKKKRFSIKIFYSILLCFTSGYFPFSLAQDKSSRIDVSVSHLSVNEGSTKSFNVSLNRVPNGRTPVNFETDLAVSLSSVVFTDRDWDSPQTVKVFAEHDTNEVDEKGEVTVHVKGFPSKTIAVDVVDDDKPEIVLSESRLSLDEGSTKSFNVSLNRVPNGRTPVNFETDLAVSLSSVVFTDRDWDSPQTVKVFAEHDTNEVDEKGEITVHVKGFPSKRIPVTILDKGRSGFVVSQMSYLPLEDFYRIYEIKAYVSIIPDSTVRVRCLREKNRQCLIVFDCLGEESDERFDVGVLSFQGGQTETLSVEDIQDLIGARSRQKSMTCLLRSKASFSAQTWIRSGDGVLVNYSQFVSSTKEGDRYRADAQSITSPKSSEDSKFQILCVGENGKEKDCTNTQLACYTDEGLRYNGSLGTLPYLTLRHFSAKELSESILYKKWKGLGLTCEIRSDAAFTLQTLTRTGGGALVNHSGH